MHVKIKWLAVRTNSKNACRVAVNSALRELEAADSSVDAIEAAGGECAHNEDEGGLH